MKPKTRTQKLEAMIRQMIKTFEDIGCDHMARIDARLWNEYYRRKASRLKIKLSKDET